MCVGSGMGMAGLFVAEYWTHLWLHDSKIVCIWARLLKI